MKHLAFLLACACVAAAPAVSEASRITARSAGEPGELLVSVRATPCARKAIFFVDHRRRWVDHSYSWRLGRAGRLSDRGLAVGRHVLSAEVVRQDGTVIHASTVAHVVRGPDGKRRWRSTAPRRDPAKTARAASSAVPGSLSSEEPEPPSFIEAGFEDGLSGWSTAGVGEVVPTVVDDIVETGESAARVALTGSENRSELILADHGSIAEFPPGTERWYRFSFNVCTMVWGHPGAHNLIMQLKSDNEGSPRFSLGLWDYRGRRGLWTEGAAMGGNRFLAPIAERRWHDVVVHFDVTTGGTGFYEVYLDGSRVDARRDITVLRPGASTAYIKTGLYRNGAEIPGLSELRLDSAALGTSLEEVMPR